MLLLPFSQSLTHSWRKVGLSPLMLTLVPLVSVRTRLPRHAFCDPDGVPQLNGLRPETLAEASVAQRRKSKIADFMVQDVQKEWPPLPGKHFDPQKTPSCPFIKQKNCIALPGRIRTEKMYVFCFLLNSFSSFSSSLKYSIQFSTIYIFSDF